MSKRREFMRGAAIGALAFTIGGVEMLLTPRGARAQGATLRLLKPDEVETLEAWGETLVPGARAARIAYFSDSPISVPPEEPLVDARNRKRRPPLAGFYRT